MPTEMTVSFPAWIHYPQTSSYLFLSEITPAHPQVSLFLHRVLMKKTLLRLAHFQKRMPGGHAPAAQAHPEPQGGGEFTGALERTLQPFLRIHLR